MGRLSVVSKGKPSRETTKLDWAVLDGQVRQATIRDIPTSQKFPSYVLRTLFGLTEDDASEAITDASQDRGIDAVLLDEANRDIHLFQFKYHEVEEHLAKQFPGRCVDNTISFADDLLQQRQQIFATSNKLLHVKIRQIWDLIKGGPVTIHIHLATNGRKLDSADSARLKEALKRYQVRLWEYGARDLIKSAVRPTQRVRRKIAFIEGARLEVAIHNRRMLTGVVSLRELALLLRHPDSRSQVDHTLFADNVRGVLGMDNEVNRSIFRTILSKDAPDFVFFNNGITIVTDQVLFQAGGNFPVEMINPQIVNGCQTASIVHQAFVIDESSLAEGEMSPSVQIRIIESADPRFTEMVALATNSQTRIYGRDLRAVDETQLKIEAMLQHHGYRYLRKRSDTTDRPKSQTIDMARLGQIMLAYYKRQPELAKTSNAIFGDLYEDVFDAQLLNSASIIAVHILSDMIEDRRQLAKQRMRSIEKRSYHEEWIIEGHFHVLFVLGLLCDRDGIELSDIRGAALRMAEAIDVVAEYASRHSNVAAYRLFRTKNTSDQLERNVDKTKKQEAGAPQLDLFADPTIQFVA